MKLTRGRMAMAAAAIVLFGFAAQAATRTVVAWAWSRAIHSDVLILGHADASLRERSIEVRKVRVQRLRRDPIEVDRVAAVLNPWSLLHRNLVIDQAYVDGASIRSRRMPTNAFRLPALTAILPGPNVDPARLAQAWAAQLHSRRGEHQSQQEALMSDLENRVAVFSRRQQHVLISKTDEPLPRGTRESLRTEYVAIRQRIAEQRIALRELHKRFRLEAEGMRDDLPKHLQQAIEEAFPEFESSMRGYLTNLLMELLAESDPLLESVWECMASPSALAYANAEPSATPIGIDVPIPGVEPSHVWVRAANLRGWIQPEHQSRIAFECSLSHWGDRQSTSDLPQSHWRFQLPKQRGVIEILSERRHDNSAGTPMVWTALRRMDPAGDHLRSARIAIEHRVDRCHVQFEVPIDAGHDSPDAREATSENAALSNSNDRDWHACLTQAIDRSTTNRSLRVRLVGDTTATSTKPFQLEFRIDPTTLFEWEPIWNGARQTWSEQTMMRHLEASREVLAHAIEAAMADMLIESENQLARLATLEAELEPWGAHWEPASPERLAQRPKP